MAVRINYQEGDKIGSLTFLRRIEAGIGRPTAIFRCPCGNELTSRIDAVKIGRTKSCGCMTSEMRSKTLTRHGHTSLKNGKSTEYTSWQSMWARMTNPKHKNFQRYQQLNISICDEWESFDVFIKDMGLKPTPLHSIERIENSKGYYKENCKWATRKEQQRNKRDTTFVEYKGVKKSVPDWAETVGLSLATVYNRIVKMGWEAEKAFTTPTKNGISPILFNNI